MQDKFTRQAANALKLAKTTAQSCNHSYIGTEHILVGLLKEKEGTAGRILEEFNVEEDALRQLIEELIAPSEVLVTEKAPEYSPRALRVLERSVQEAENAGVMEYIAATEYIEETEAAEDVETGVDDDVYLTIPDDAEESETVDDAAVETETDVEEDEAAASYEDEDFSEFAEFGSTDEYEQLAEEDTNEDA